MWTQWVSHAGVWITLLENKNISRVSATASSGKHPASAYPPQKKTVLPSGAGSGLIFYHCGGSILRGKGKIEVVLQADSRITISGGWGLNCIVRKYSHIPPQQPRQKEFIFRNRLRKASQFREYISGRFRWCYCLGWKVASEKRFSWWYGPFTSPGYLSCPEDPLNVWQRPVCHVK